jgi:CRP-like cAMP-binding protein
MNFESVRRAVLECPHFKALSRAQHGELLLTATVKEYPAGTTIFEAGQTNDGTFILLLSGRLVARRAKDDAELGNMAVGELSGEIAQTQPAQARTASVTAVDPSLALLWSFPRIQRDSPELAEALMKQFEEVGWGRLVGGSWLS